MCIRDSTYISAGSITAIVTSYTPAGSTSVPVRFASSVPSAGSVSSLTISATRAVPRVQILNAVGTDIYALSGMMFKALSPYSPSSAYTALNSEITTLSTAVTYGSTSFVIPATTPTAGADSLYLFDYKTVVIGENFDFFDLHEGTGDSALWTQLSTTASAGATSITLSSVAGLGTSGSLTIDKGTTTEETVTISSSWDGSALVTLASPLWYSHGNGSNVYAQTNSIVTGFASDIPSGSPVAVFNWNNDGYINTPQTSYRYKVEKSEDYGNTWRTLYLGDTLLADATGVAEITDFEVTPNIQTYYRATPSFVSQTGNITQGVTSPPLAVAPLTTNSWWLASSSDETLRYAIAVQNGVEETQKHPVGVFYPLGSRRPLTVAGVPQGRDASIKVIWTDEANWAGFYNLLNKGETLILVDPVESERRYIFIHQDIAITHQAAVRPYREITIPFVEVAPPNFGYTYGS